MKLKTAPGTLIAAISKWLFVCGLLCVLFYPSIVKAQKDYTVRNGETVTVDPFPATGCVYQWTNDNPGIGLPASGTGDIAAFKAVNNGFTPIKAKIMVSTVPVQPQGYGAVTGGLAVLDIGTLAVKEMVPVPNGILAGISPSGNEIYVINNSDRTALYVVSTVNNQVLKKIDIPAGVPPISLMITPDGSKIYMLNTKTGPQTISWINTADRTLHPVDLPVANGRMQYPVMSADGSKIFLASDIPTNLVTVFDTGSNSVSATISVNRPGQMVPTRDGKKLYIFNAAQANGSVYDFTTSTLTTIVTGGSNLGPVLSPDGNSVYVTSGSNGQANIKIIDVATDNVTEIPVPVNSGFFFSKDGKYAYAVNGRLGDVSVISTASKQLVTTIPINASDQAGANTKISYSTGDLSFDGTRLYVLNKVQFTAIGSVPTGHNYVSVINTSDNKVIDSIETSTITTIKTTSAGACNTTPYSFTITVNPDPAVINTSGPVTGLFTTYGTSSIPGNFGVYGSKIGGGILMTAPADFEVSTDDLIFKDQITVGGTGTVPLTPVYYRLKATAKVGNHSGSITLSNNGTELKVAIPTSTVRAADLTIKPGIITKIYGATLTTTTGSTNFTATGLKNGETIGGVTLAYGTGSVATDPVGTYPTSVSISAPTGGTFSADNYNINKVKGDATVTPAPLTITADNKSRLVDEDNPILTFIYSGFVNNEGPAVLVGKPAISTTAIRSSTAGVYPITLSGASAANYTMIYKTGTMTVLPRQITVSNTFTPNGDGINDTWEIKYIYLYPKCTVEVYNRNGNKILYSLGYPTAWDGKYNGSALQTGTYYYIVNLNNGTKPVTGSITIIR